ncbi:gamma-glutamyl-gamma-aminobutyrate hydrolase family protein [Emticicia sp. TH156]|uniref:gamma-glutamyl-gamma-aminobutyrate hydrolase family protein n=1 Tax=Emticicia sp. TH156 TaxID=2067454 RepID=UPI000C7676DA|nr:gamma-glutamyl-gamma-aminobutyrate hydrolase family protein [Emticicia sp. TH156]PLK43100.1 peptidase C26 [Emticicia sp. TH156]
MSITIGITDCGDKHPIYEKWILRQNADIKIIRLGYRQNNLDDVKFCDGVLLTGGEDVNPRFYFKPENLPLCNSEFMDEKRDEFEWKICEYVFANKVPLLGICRGLQFVNVFLGGTLIGDIPSIGKNNHSKYYEGKDRYHLIEVSPDSTLAGIAGATSGEINSAHHQSVDIPAQTLKINAMSEDGIVEGLEWKAVSDHALTLVQWHPERIENEHNPFNYRIREVFINAASGR